MKPWGAMGRGALRKKRALRADSISGKKRQQWRTPGTIGMNSKALNSLSTLPPLFRYFSMNLDSPFGVGLAPGRPPMPRDLK